MPFSVVEVSLSESVSTRIEINFTLTIFSGPCSGPVDSGCYPKAGIC